MAVKLGSEAKLYFSAAGIGGTPVWTEITNVKDLTLNVEQGEADVTTRGTGGWKATIGTLKDAVVEWEMVWDTEDAGFEAVRDAFFGGTALGLAVMDGPVDTAGSEGLWADCAILKFDRSEALEEAITVSVTAKPTYSANPPEWQTVGGTSNVVLQFSRILVDGAGSLDLTAIPHGSGTYDGTGKRIAAIRISNNGADSLTVSAAESNGYDLLDGADLVVPAGATAQLMLDDTPTIGSTAKLLDLAGVGTQASTWTLTLATVS